MSSQVLNPVRSRLRMRQMKLDTHMGKNIGISPLKVYIRLPITWTLVYSNFTLTWTKIDFYWIIPSYIYCSVILHSVTQSNFFPSDQYFCIILLLITQTVFKTCNKSKKQTNQQSSVFWNTGFTLKQLCILFLYFFVSKVQIQCPALYINQAFNVLQLNSIIFAGFKILYQNTTVCSRF